MGSDGGRRALSRLRTLVVSRPRLAPFVPVVASALLGRERPGPPQLPTVEPAGAPATRPRTETVDLVVFSVIRNGITNGYPFIEAFGSWLGYADRVLVVDGQSDDGTREALDQLAAIDPSFVVVSEPWPETQSGGTAIAQLTNSARAHAGAQGERLVYIQADEIYTPAQRRLLAEHRSPTALEFSGCTNFWNSFHSVVANEFPMRYLRMFPASASAVSLGDGYSFDVDVEIEHLPDMILHYGWCFPVNILYKHVSHGRLYSDDPGYRLRGMLARLLLEQRRYDRRFLDALAPQYRPTPFTGTHPDCMAHVLSQVVYDPNQGLELLRSGVRW
jgi:hypothetical protein